DAMILRLILIINTMRRAGWQACGRRGDPAARNSARTGRLHAVSGGSLEVAHRLPAIGKEGAPVTGPDPGRRWSARTDRRASADRAAPRARSAGRGARRSRRARIPWRA